MVFYTQKSYNYSMKPQTIIFIGRSGSGKGTQAKWLKEYLESKEEEVFHLESGKKFRQLIHHTDSYTAKLATEVNKEGKLQPEFLSVYIWTSELVEHMDEKLNVLIDGTPRRLDETKVLETAFEFYKRDNIHVIYLGVSEEVAIERLKNRGREDDKDIEDIKERQGWFETDVMPVIDYYRSTDYYHFHEVNGAGDIEEIHENILKAIND